MIDDPVEKARELELARKALSGNIQKLKRFVYTDDDNLRKQIILLYPEATDVIIVNLDKRDGLGTPTVSSRQICRVHSYTNTYRRGRVVSSDLNGEVFSLILALVNDNFVSIKKVTRRSPSY